MNNASQEIDRALPSAASELIEATQQLYDKFVSGALITVFAYSMLTFVFPGQAPTSMLHFFQLAMPLIVLLRCVDWMRWRKHGVTEENVYSFNRRFVVLTLITGVCWASAGSMLFQYQSIEERYYMLLTLGSMTGGAVNVLAASRLLALAYPALLIFPIVGVCLFSEVTSLQVVGISGIAYGLVMLSLGNNAAVGRKAAIRAQLLLEMERNSLEQLNAKLQIAQSRLASSNAELESKVDERTAEIYRLSNMDPLTGLLNRTAFLSRLETHIESSPSKPLALLFIDLDGFKSINDALGHQLGDQVLITVAEKLSLSAKGQILCRWGGDEFVLLSDQVEHTALASFANQMLKHIYEQIEVAGNRLQVKASLGVAMYPEHSRRSNGLIECADMAMYEAKSKAGQTIEFYSQSLKTRLAEEHGLISSLTQALDKQQLSLMFQPIVDADTQRPRIVEALLRWNLDGRQIPPDEFIPLAEKSGLIVEIGAWVLQTACELATQWTSATHSVLSVNVSFVQLMRADFVDTVNTALHHSGLPPERLCLEITETIFMESGDAIVTTIEAIRAIGVTVAIDDFGTGYSNLGKLNIVPANILKIDKSFIGNETSKDEVVIRAAVMIAEEHGYQVVAEGVETLAQAEHLASCGVAYLQGFYFSRPMTHADMDVWWNEKIARGDGDTSTLCTSTL